MHSVPMKQAVCLFFVLSGLTVFGVDARQEGAKVPIAIQAFDLNEVRLLEGPFKTAQEANRRYLHELDFDRLLWTFRKNAGLSAPGQPLGGWEAPDCEVRGHFIGHYLSACALMYASTGDETLKAKADDMVSELAKCQEALGGGYLSAYPESFLDRLESMERVTWATLYVIHKIMAGLLDMHQLTGNQQALDVLKKMAAYFKRRADKLSDFQMERMLTVEFGGMSETLHNLYGITRDPAHLELAHRYDQAAFLGPLALERDNLSHIHGNTQIPKVCGAARHYELTGDKRYRTITRFFWDRVVKTRTYATGGTTEAEVWPEPNALARTLAANNQECCKTHNMLKVTRYLLRWTGDPTYGDYYERALLNGILGTQRSDNGQLIYYVPLATGCAKQWGTPYDSFWCCYGTGIESFAKLGDSLYFHDRSNLYVNLFVASTVTWRAKNLRLEQVTSFPEEEGTTLLFHLNRPTRLGLKVRVPSWATHGLGVKINGKLSGKEARPSTYLSLNREWKDGDRVEIAMPMALHSSPMPDGPELVAVMYGPVVLAGVSPPQGTYLLGDPKDPSQWVEKTGDGPLTFAATGQKKTVRLVPWYKVIDEPYGVYWTVTSEGSPRHKAMLAEEEARQKRESRIVDRVKVGDNTSEEEHHLQGENTGSGPYADRFWRHALGGGWWSWDMKVLPEVPMTLVCTYWGSDVPPRKFDILVEGVLVGMQDLNRNKPNEFFEVEYAIPAELTKGKEKVTVRFQGHKDNMAGGVFDCATLRP
ncbi:MAG: glycoside hydrolase family 127 protein [Armatimonadetes bacterium]|nr:glycoside hydrolase family 127 protein [Armatimonadota bacterium]